MSDGKVTQPSKTYHQFGRSGSNEVPEISVDTLREIIEKVFLCLDIWEDSDVDKVGYNIRQTSLNGMGIHCTRLTHYWFDKSTSLQELLIRRFEAIFLKIVGKRIKLANLCGNFILDGFNLIGSCTFWIQKPYFHQMAYLLLEEKDES